MENDKYIGKVYGRITLVEREDVKGSRKYIGLCECGNLKSYYLGNLKSGRTKSCGCFYDEARKDANATHRKTGTRLYRIYNNMKTRCYNKKTPNYSRYGGKGVRVCDEWLEDFTIFYNWAINNGYKEYLTIDRIDSNGNYEPSNCRWVDYAIQSHNRDYSWNIKINGITKNAKEWCEINEVNYKTAHSRKMNGWSDIDCVSKEPTKPIKARNIKTGEIITFISVYEASKNGFNDSSIRLCLKGKQKHHKGYIWSKYDKE